MMQVVGTGPQALQGIVATQAEMEVLSDTHEWGTCTSLAWAKR